MTKMIPWPGGECPVPPEAVVEVELRCGTVSEIPAYALDWKDNPSHPASDIIAYRVVTPSPLSSQGSAAVTKPTLDEAVERLTRYTEILPQPEHTAQGRFDADIKLLLALARSVLNPDDGTIKRVKAPLLEQIPFVHFIPDDAVRAALAAIVETPDHD